MLSEATCSLIPPLIDSEVIQSTKLKEVYGKNKRVGLDDGGQKEAFWFCLQGVWLFTALVLASCDSYESQAGHRLRYVQQ